MILLTDLLSAHHLSALSDTLAVATPQTAKLFDGVIQFLQGALESYGYVIVFLAIMIESMGVPFPGETMLLIASAVSATTNAKLSIFGVIGSAAGGAIVGDSLGYWIGREGGRKVIRKYGKYVGLTDDRYAKAQDYLKKHGGKAVFFGRFVSIARTWIAVLVGAHHFNYPQFLIYNVLGGVVWATLYGTIGYVAGTNLPLVEKWVSRAGITLSIIAAAVIVYLWYLRKKRKAAKASQIQTTVTKEEEEEVS
jgi:membrane protein DedA with SNARE-associated domain